MGVSIDLSALYARFDEQMAAAAAVNTAAVEQGALVIERAVKEEIQGGHPKRQKTGATPGGPPQNVTGNLRRSVASHVLTAGIRAEAHIGPSAYYGGYVEGGTPRMPAYPYVQPGAEKSRPAAHAAIIAAWQRGFGA